MRRCLTRFALVPLLCMPMTSRYGIIDERSMSKVVQSLLGLVQAGELCWSLLLRVATIEGLFSVNPCHDSSCKLFIFLSLLPVHHSKSVRSFGFGRAEVNMFRNL
ncbi:hypothetical protein EDB19DRAFT_1764743 [Suillus lakei]|nr:hypothetical protein EDB19DRAFT_1764743 [Suillus lakei]